jgi:hypothetical protein
LQDVVGGEEVEGFILEVLVAVVAYFLPELFLKDEHGLVELDFQHEVVHVRQADEAFAIFLDDDHHTFFRAASANNYASMVLLAMIILSNTVNLSVNFLCVGSVCFYVSGIIIMYYVLCIMY